MIKTRVRSLLSRTKVGMVNYGRIMQFSQKLSSTMFLYSRRVIKFCSPNSVLFDGPCLRTRQSQTPYHTFIRRMRWAGEVQPGPTRSKTASQSSEQIVDHVSRNDRRCTSAAQQIIRKSGGKRAAGRDGDAGRAREEGRSLSLTHFRGFV